MRAGNEDSYSSVRAIRLPEFCTLGQFETWKVTQPGAHTLTG